MYDEIKSQFDDDNTLIEIVKLYTNSKDLYREIIEDRNYDENMFLSYLNNFNKYIKIPSISRLYDFLSNVDASNATKQVDEYEKYLDTIPELSSEQKEKIMNSIKKNWLYPLSKYTPIFNQFKSYQEIEVYYTKNKINQIQNYLDNIMLYKDINESVANGFKNEIKKITNISDEEINKLLFLNEFKKKIKYAFDGGEGIMGFHINPKNLNPKTQINIQPDIKLYINAGTDSYQFANLFQKKCEEQNIEYIYKVVDPYKRESHRCDKICIWSSYKNIEKYINIIREIKKEHPEFNYQNPPLLCGRLDDFIGIGQDFSNNSYNKGMCKIIDTAIKNVFNGIEKDEILNTISKNHNKLNELRNEIKKLTTEKGLDPTKICIKNDAKNNLPKILKANTTQNSNEEKIIQKKPTKNNINQINTTQNNPNKNNINQTNITQNNNIPKPRNRNTYETNEEYKKYLEEYYNSVFNKETELSDTDTLDEYFPGTNILKPRNRGIYETDEEYEEFLEKYYNSVFNTKKEINDMLNDNENNTITDTRKRNK